MKNIIFILLISVAMFAEEKIQITMGESKILAVDAPKKIAVGNPIIADVKSVSEKELLLIGKSSGTTSLIIWDKEGNQSTSQVIVLASNIEKTMVEVNAQIMEIRKDNDNNFGIKWEETVGALTAAEKTLPPLFQLADFERLQKVQVKLGLLVKNGYAKILAKPRLLTISGSKAKFLAGGEIPVLIQSGSQNSPNTSVDWKTYGVKLDIEPTADALDNINCLIRVEVSNLDSSAGVSYNGSVVPATKTRWADTSIYVKKGGTIVIGGLLQTEDVKRETGIPVLCDLPLIGALFKSIETQKQESELVIFVTPSIVGK
ncbi:MAG: pilus assembly protein N-terminal domain-containing protein [Candidatus Firestonebacteria bacterium]